MFKAFVMATAYFNNILWLDPRNSRKMKDEEIIRAERMSAFKERLRQVGVGGMPIATLNKDEKVII